MDVLSITAIRCATACVKPWVDLAGHLTPERVYGFTRSRASNCGSGLVVYSSARGLSRTPRSCSIEFMIGGASWTWWIGFHVAVPFSSSSTHCCPAHAANRSRSPDCRLALDGRAGRICSRSFAGWIAVRQGRVPALQFVAGYTIETSLSVDNLFVFLVLFQGFRISPRAPASWRCCGESAGAIVLRALFIAAGVTLLQRFDWITYVFGVFLLYAAWRLLRGGSARAAIPGWIRRSSRPRSLLPVILAVEFTDLLFAVDSIPAVLAISHDPFVVYTSNIAAMLGLRSLYFALAALLDRFRYLHYGLGALLAFVALKMLASHWLDVPITYSLAIIGAILAICALASGWRRKQGIGIGESGIRDRLVAALASSCPPDAPSGDGSSCTSVFPDP